MSWLMGFILRMWDYIYEINYWNIQHKGSKPYEHLNRCRKNIWQNPAAFHDTDTQQSGHRRELPQSAGECLWKTHSSCRRLNAFALKSGRRGRCLFSPLLFNNLLETLVRAIEQEKEICKWHLDWDGRTETIFSL